MLHTDSFVALCKKLVSDAEGGLMDYHMAAGSIIEQGYEYPLAEDIHPMLGKLVDLAYDITDPCREDMDDEANWSELKRTLQDYVSGNWEPTCWVLTVMYRADSDSSQSNAYSLTVHRRNGDTTIECSSDVLKNHIQKCCDQIRSEQTDERYLQNLAKLIPKSILNFTSTSVEVKEHLLISPYIVNTR